MYRFGFVCFSSFLAPLIPLINSVKHVRLLINLKKGLLNLIATLALSLMKFGQTLNRKGFFSVSLFVFSFFPPPLLSLRQKKFRVFLRKLRNSSIPGHERRILIRIRQRASRCWACSLLNPLPCSCIPAWPGAQTLQIAASCQMLEMFSVGWLFTRSRLKPEGSYNGCISCLKLGWVSHCRQCWGKILYFWEWELAVLLLAALWYPFAKSNSKN